MSTPTTATTGTPATAESRRAAALETSAWGESFYLIQPRNLCFWIYVAMLGYSIYNIVDSYSRITQVFTDAVVIAIALNAALAAVWWLWFRRIDRWERQPIPLVITAFVWGGIPATFGLAITGNGALISLWTKWFGQEWAGSWEAALTAPFVEETSKFAGFLLIMGLASRLVRTPNDGLIIGAFIGLGFQVFEDVTYAVNGALSNFATDPVGGALGTGWLRVATGFVSHPLYSALCCTGLIYLIGTKAQERRIFRGLTFIVAGMGTHMIWDSVVAFSNSGIATAGVLLAAIAIGLVTLEIAFRVARNLEFNFARDILAPEVQSGLLTPEQVDSSLDREHRRKYTKGAANRKAKRRRKRLANATYKLVHELAESKGADSRQVDRARTKIARFRTEA